MKNLFNERVMAEDILENGFSNNYATKFELILLAKHYKWIDNLGTTRIKKKIIEFCKENDEGFNPVIKRDLINDVIKIAENNKFRKPVAIQITNNELARIREVKDYTSQIILFILLAFSKTLKYMNTDVSGKSSHRKHIGYFVNFGMLSKIKKSGNIRETNRDIMKILHKLYKLEYIEPTYYNSIRVLYADDTGIPVLFIDNFDNLYKVYKEYTGGELLYCDNCGIEFVKVGNKKDLCNDCYAEKRREQNREKVARYRQRNKI